MADNPSPDEVYLETFLRAAGQSFTDAQKSLLPGLDLSVNMMLSSAELDIKVAISSDSQGKMSIKTISSTDLTRGDIDPGLLSTLHINFVSSIEEIKPQPLQPVPGTSRARVVPNLIGRKMGEAIALLESGGWHFEKHAASIREIASAGKESSGLVLKQEPLAGQTLDSSKGVIHFWVNLGGFSVKDIDGIGDKLGSGLHDIGITSVGQLSLAAVDRIASALKISPTRVQDFVDMAGLMSSLAVIGCKDKVELLVKGMGIRSVEQLAEVDPEELYRNCYEAIDSSKVRVPREFKLTADEVQKWVNAAKCFVTDPRLP